MRRYKKNKKGNIGKSLLKTETRELRSDKIFD